MRRRFKFGHSIIRFRVSILFIVLLGLAAICQLIFTNSIIAFERTNVPIKNWGGFSVNRSWVYDALEKVVLSGLADQVLLNTKPITRVEAARIVGQAVRRLKLDQHGDYNHRGYLEELLYQLIGEFGSELSEMGVRTSINKDDVNALSSSIITPGIHPSHTPVAINIELSDVLYRIESRKFGFLN